MLPVISIQEMLLVAVLSYGLATILRVGRPLRPLREWMSRRSSWISEFLHCPMCLGFWAGLFWWWYWGLPTSWWWPCMVAGAAGSYVITVIVDRVDDRGTPPIPPITRDRPPHQRQPQPPQETQQETQHGTGRRKDSRQGTPDPLV